MGHPAPGRDNRLGCGNSRQNAMNYTQHFRGCYRAQTFLLLLDAYFQIATPAIGAVVNNLMLFAPREPDPRPVARRKYNDAWRADGGSQMHWSAIVANKQPRTRQHRSRFARCQF